MAEKATTIHSTTTKWVCVFDFWDHRKNEVVFGFQFFQTEQKTSTSYGNGNLPKLFLFLISFSLRKFVCFPTTTSTSSTSLFSLVTCAFSDGNLCSFSIWQMRFWSWFLGIVLMQNEKRIHSFGCYSFSISKDYCFFCFCSTTTSVNSYFKFKFSAFNSIGLV